MTGNIKFFLNPPTPCSGQQVTISSGKIFRVHGIGKIVISNSSILHDVFYIPEFKVNLILVSKLTLDNDIKVEFHGETCVFQENKFKKSIGQGSCHDGLYLLNSSSDYANIVLDYTKRHQRLGHPSSKKLKILAKGNYLDKNVIL